jgi:hypothetical protein
MNQPMQRLVANARPNLTPNLPPKIPPFPNPNPIPGVTPVTIDVEFDQLSVFSRSYESSEPLIGVPLYAIATLGAPVPENAQPAAGAPDLLVHIPLGLVASNHAGYASFDLTVLRARDASDAYIRELVRANLPVPDANHPQTLAVRKLWLFPFADPLLALDALQAGDIGPNYIVVRLELDANQLAARKMEQPAVAMQNPNILDWRLSPGSFTLSGMVLVGQDGCESLLPANLATQVFRFRQVAQAGRTRTERDRVFGAGHVLEYTSEWFAVGHSLGQLMYTLPLAPGEVVKMAVVDWSRSTTAGRTEDTGLTESLVHDQVRDRTLTESVHAVLDEWQRGGSIMGGTASSAGAGLSEGGMVSAGVGLTNVLGGAYTTSSGTRDLSAQTTQQIADARPCANCAPRCSYSRTKPSRARCRRAWWPTTITATRSRCCITKCSGTTAW